MNEKHEQPNNPFHGVTLEKLLTSLVEHYGWDELYGKMGVNCFNNNPSIKSCLKFFRQTGWARSKLETLYLDMLWEERKNTEEK